ncbi:MAG: hypothetical protein JW709_12520 [Sedimentisphaerales bacterium]|nr:hypothetical protein [Sedimentisphaerales bacterium]
MNIYKSIETSREFPPMVNYVNMVLQFLYSVTIAALAFLIPMRYGFLYIYRLMEKGGKEGNSVIKWSEGLLNFEGGFGALCILAGLALVALTTYKVTVVKEKIMKNQN